jgi:hypothetical protein
MRILALHISPTLFALWAMALYYESKAHQMKLQEKRHLSKSVPDMQKEKENTTKCRQMARTVSPP